MSGFIVAVLIVCGCFTVTVLGCVSMGTSYAEKKRGLQQGASQREIEALQQQVTEMRNEVDAVKKHLQELIQIAKGIAE